MSVEKGADQPKDLTQFDLLEKAISSLNEADPRIIGNTITNEEQSNLVGSELGKIAVLKDVLDRNRVTLPETNVTSAQWATAERLYITHLLNPDEDSTRMLQYFQKQHDHALAQEKRALMESTPTTNTVPARSKGERLSDGIIASVITAGVGLAMLTVTYATQDSDIRQMYPILSSDKIEAADPTPKNTSALSSEQLKELSAKVEIRRVMEKQRKDILNGRLLNTPTTWIGGAAATAGAVGASVLGLMSIFHNSEGKSSDDQPNQGRRRSYKVVTKSYRGPRK